MSYKKVGSDQSIYLKFQAGKSFEGIYQGCEERDNPFYHASNPNSSKTIIDYKLEIDGEVKVLSSTANTLKNNLMPLAAPQSVKIDCIQKGPKKFYSVWTVEE